MRPFEVDDISPIDMERVQQLTADFMKAENGGRTGAEQQLAQELHCVLKPYNKFSSSLLLKRVETTMGCHVCAFFHECSRTCRYEHGGYSWHQEKLAWKPLDLRYTGVRSAYCEESDYCYRATGGAHHTTAGSSSEESSPRGTPPTGNSPRSISPRRNPTAAVLPSLQLAHAAPDQPFTQIPVVDFGEFLHGSSSQQREVAAQIGDACRNVGFMYLVNHGVPQSLINDVFAVSKQFFDLPLETKREVAYVPGGFRGYFGVRAEDLDQHGLNKPGSKKGDLKEGFDAGLEAGRLPLGCQSSATFHAPNRWPTEPMPEMQVVMSRYLDTLRSLSERLSEAFALSLGLPQHYFQRATSAPCINLRVNHYPPRPDGEGVGCGAHSDYGLFTILAQDLVGGLQVRNSVGDWVAATPLEGSFVINIGDMMQRWTNNIYSSTVHRVVASSTNGETPRRFSIPFFFNANREAQIECLPTCVSEDRPALYEPDCAENILQARYNQAFNKK